MDGALPLILLLSMSEAVLSVVQLEPRNVTVLRGSAVHFNCSTSALWDVMIWQLNDRVVLTISARFGPLGDSLQYRAENRSGAERSAWEFVLGNVAAGQQEVACEIQNLQRETAALIVQEKGTVEILGGDRSVQRGGLVLLQCQAFGWFPEPSVWWRVNGSEVDISESNTSAALGLDGLVQSSSVLSVQPQGSTGVECQASITAMTVPLSSTITLSLATERDGTVLTAVMTTLCLLALLLLALGLAFILHRRAHKQRQQDEMRLGREAGKRNSVSMATGGKVNLGYHSEGHTGAAHADPADGVPCQTSSISTLRIPDVIGSNPRGAEPDSCSAFRGEEPRKTRLATTV